MEFSPLNCPICYERFDQAERLPRVIPICGHTLCSFCLVKVLKNSSTFCPLDKKSFENLKKIEDFPVNYILTQLHVEDRISAGVCTDHKKEARFACLTDKLKLCYECISKDGHHKDHKVVSLDDLRFKAAPQRSEMKELLDYVEGCYKKASKDLDDERHDRLKRVKLKMEQFKNALYQKELELNFEINYYYDQQVSKLNEATKETKALRNGMSAKISNLINFSQENDMFMSENYFDDLIKYIQECKVSLNSVKLQEELYSMKAIRYERSEILEASISKQVQLLSKIEFSVKSSCDDYLKAVAPNKVETEISEPEDKPTILQALSCLKIEKSGCDLEIIAQDRNPSELILGLGNLETYRNITIDIKRSTIGQKDLEILNYIMQKLKKIAKIKLRFVSGSFSYNLYQVLAQNLNNCSTIEIDIEGYQEESPLVLSLIKLILRMGIFKDIVLNMKSTKLAWDNSNLMVMKELFEDIKVIGLTLGFDQSNLSDSHLRCLTLPSMLETLDLSFHYSSLEKETIKAILNGALSPLGELKELLLDLHGTKVTADEIESLSVLKSKSLKVLCLDIGGIEITGRSINSLSKFLTQFSDHLESFTLGLGGSKIADKDLMQLKVKIPKLKYLYFQFNSIPITDKSIEALIDNFICSSMELLELHLSVANTNISDNSVRKIFQNVEGIRNLIVDFSNTNVSDQSIKPLVREVLPKLENLEKIKINVSCTRVSKAVSQKLEECAKVIESLE